MMLSSRGLGTAAAGLRSATVAGGAGWSGPGRAQLARTAVTVGAPLATGRTLFTRSASFPLARTRQLVSVVLALALGTFGVAYYVDARSGIHRWVTLPLLRLADPETAHRLALKLLETGLAPRDLSSDDAVLETNLFGRTLSNPIGLAAGFDKQADAIDALLDLGFGFVEIGSVTPKPQPGNNPPRYFRLVDDNACINRFGFNSDGHCVILGRLRDRIRRWILLSSSQSSLQGVLATTPESAAPDVNQLLASHPQSTSAFVDAVGLPRSLQPAKLLGINLGKNKTSAEDSVDDYVKGVETLGPYADMIIVNVSSPNTPGLRRLQRRGVLEDLLTKVVEARDAMTETHMTLSKTKICVPLLVKIAPDLSEEELHDVADAVVKCRVDGLVISNTTIARPASLRSADHIREPGGLSGPPLKPLALQALSTVYRRLDGKVPIIGCGGIASGQDVLDYAKAGASAVELYTSFGYQGVGLPRKIKDELTALLKAEGKTWSQAIGSGIDLSAIHASPPAIHASPPDDSTRQGLHPARDHAFEKSVASVKLELDGLREKLGLSPTLSRETLQSFLPSRETDASYFTLLQDAHAALGLEFAAAETRAASNGRTAGENEMQMVQILLQDPNGPSMDIQLNEATTKIFGNTPRGKVHQAEQNAANREFGNIDNSRVV